MNNSSKATDKNFHGIWTAIATPFKANFSIDWSAYEKMLSMQINAGVTGIVVLGTTGEAPTLTMSEKLELVSKTKSLIGGQAKIMAGTGSYCTASTVELSQQAVNAGADSLLIVTPPYNKPSPAGLKLHFQLICEAVDVPVCLYHVPSRTAQHLTAEMIAELCTIPKVAFVKEASGSLHLFSKANATSAAGFFSGDDFTYLPSLAVGGIGCISVVSNIFPKEMVQMTSLVAQGDMQGALAYHDALLPFMEALFVETSPGPLKAALEMKGIAKNVLRAPLAPVTNAHYERINHFLFDTEKNLQKLL